jgi:hypothetical protein
MPKPKSRSGPRPLKAPAGPLIWAVIMCGNAEATIGRAVMSVTGLVDRVFILDTGITDNTLKVAAKTWQAPVGSKRWAWRNDFGAARTAALKAAADRAGERDWLLILDSDEWYGIKGAPVLHAIVAAANPDCDAFHVEHVGGEYGQPRLVRASSVRNGRAFFSGVTHEAMTHNFGAMQYVKQIVFCDEPKNLEQSLAKFERDYDALHKETERRPEAQRERYYLAQTCECLAETIRRGGELTPAQSDRAHALDTEAIATYRKVVAMGGWSVEGAWAAYKGATRITSPHGRAVTAEERRQGRELAAAGLTRYPTSELAWLAGYLSFYLDEYEQALAWSRMAIAIGGPLAHARPGFRYPLAIWEKPYDVAAFALDKLGCSTEAAEMRRLSELAKAQRTQTPAT